MRTSLFKTFKEGQIYVDFNSADPVRILKLDRNKQKIYVKKYGVWGHQAAVKHCWLDPIDIHPRLKGRRILDKI